MMREYLGGRRGDLSANNPPVDVVEDERYVDCAVWGSGSIVILQRLFLVEG